MGLPRGARLNGAAQIGAAQGAAAAAGRPGSLARDGRQVPRIAMSSCWCMHHRPRPFRLASVTVSRAFAPDRLTSFALRSGQTLAASGSGRSARGRHRGFEARTARRIRWRATARMSRRAGSDPGVIGRPRQLACETQRRPALTERGRHRCSGFDLLVRSIHPSPRPSSARTVRAPSAMATGDHVVSRAMPPSQDTPAPPSHPNRSE
jgi:hypothetical protein